MTHGEGQVVYTMDTPVHVVSRLHAELVCFEAGMDMKKLEWLRWLNDPDLLGHTDHGMEFPALDYWPTEDGWL